jgi:hypothetical protein
MKKLGFFTMFVCSLFIVSCQLGSEERVVKGEAYFPVKLGKEALYKVDTVLYNPFNQSVDTISHVFKEIIVEKYPDNSGDTIFRIELQFWDRAKGDYVTFKSFERKIINNYAIEKLENKAEVKMLFPIAQYKTKGSGYTWNTNMFNSQAPVIIKYSSVFSSYNNGVKSYPDCIVLKLNKPQSGIIDNNNIVINNVREEVYAKDQGLIYRFIDSTDNLAVQSALSGKRITVRRID